MFRRDGTLYRSVSDVGMAKLDALHGSGLYDRLAGQGFLVEHESVDRGLALEPHSAAMVIKPRELPFVSYPYEWCFGQLKDAALLTLEIQSQALDHGLTLSDASAFNVQFDGCRPVFIDTLSFEEYKPGLPWSAYRQFCQHFLAPLALVSRVDVRLATLTKNFIDGLPLDLAANILGRKGWFSPGLAAHVHLHSRSQERFRDSGGTAPKLPKVSLQGLRGIVDSLRRLVNSLQWKRGPSEWIDYYEANNNYAGVGLDEKERIVAEMSEAIGPRIVWDLGANTGRFSRITASQGAFTIAWDMDASCVEAHYCRVKDTSEIRLLPLVNDLTNPSPSLGWAHAERDSLGVRANAQLSLALGLLHHLAIGNNVPLPQVMRWLRSLSPNVIVEWIPKEDSQVQRLLATRSDIFPEYDLEGFERALRPYFDVAVQRAIPGTKRQLFLLVPRPD